MEKPVVSILAPFDSLKIKGKRKFEFAFKLNQVHLPLIHYNYMVKNYRLHYSGYSDTRGVTTLPLA
jgi:hypothetical protein